MSESQYRLPCACGRENSVESTQAGQEIVCACGAKLTVPTLRGLRTLTAGKPPAPEARAAPPSPRSASSVTGCFFALAVLTLVGCGLFSAAMLVQRARLTSHRTFDELRAEGAKQMEDLSLDDSYHVWMHFEKDGIGGEPPTPDIAEWALARMYVRLATGGGIAAGLALIAMVGIGIAARPKKA